MNCDHQFIKILTMTQSNGNSPFSTCVCAFCGQCRRVYADGKIIIKRKAGDVSHEEE